MGAYKFKDFPEHILEVIKLECEMQDSVLNLDEYAYHGKDEGGFTWNVSIFGETFWSNILENSENSMEHNINYFNEKINKTLYNRLGFNDGIKETKELRDGLTTYIVSKKGEKYKITVEKCIWK